MLIFCKYKYEYEYEYIDMIITHRMKGIETGSRINCITSVGTFYVFRMYVFRKYFSEKINYFHFLKCYSVFFQKIIMPFLTFLKKYTSSFQKNISTFFNTQIVKMVKIATIDISVEITSSFQKNFPLF